MLLTGEPLHDVEVQGETPARERASRIWTASYYPIVGEDGLVAGVGGVLIEVTERRRAERRLRVQQAVTAILADGGGRDDVIPRVLEKIAEQLEWEAGAYWPVEAGATAATCRHVYAARGLAEVAEALNGRRIARGETFAGEIWAAAQPQWITDPDGTPRGTPLAGVRSGFGFPALVGGEVVGVLEFFSRRERSPEPELVDVVAALGRNIGQFVRRTRVETERARLLVAEQRAREAAEAAATTLEKLAQVTEVALAHVSLRDLLNALLGRVVRVMDADTAVILLADDSGSQLTVRASVGLTEGDVEVAVPVPLGEGLAGRVAASRAPLLVDDLGEHSLVSPTLRRRGIRSLVAIPLVVEDQVIGVVHAGSEQLGHFTAADARLLELIADRIALAVHQSALYEAERAAQERLVFLGEASSVLASSLDYEETLATVARLAVPRLADWCAVDMVVGDEIKRVAVAHVDPAKVDFAVEVFERRPPTLDDVSPGGLAHVLRTGAPVLVEDLPPAAVSDALAGDPELRERVLELGLRSYMIVPLVLRGRPIGAISLVEAESGRRYGEGDLPFAQELAARAAIAVDNARLYRAAEEARTRLGFLADASALLAMALDAETALTRLGNLVAGRIADWCAIHLTNEQGLPRLVTVAHPDEEKAAAAQAFARSLASARNAEHGVGKVIGTGEPELFTRVPDELLEGPVKEVGIHSTLIVPLRARGRTLGALTLVQAETSRPFTDADVAFAEDLARRAGVAVDNAELYREAAERAQAARVLAAVGDGVVLVDRGGIVRYWNRAAAAMTGLSSRDLVDRPLLEALPGWATVGERAPLAVEGERNPRPESLPLALGDRELWLSVAGVEVDDGVVYAFRDLTEDRALDELKTEFVSTVSHELRTPLAAIYGAAMTLRRTDVKLDDTQRNALLTVVSNESDRLARTVNDILWASRLDTDTLRVAIESCDALALAGDVVNAQRTHLPPGIDLRLEAVEPLPPVAADADKVRQVLVNLVDNGVKYSPDGGVVRVGVSSAGAHVRFSITDEGIGIPHSEQRRIFEKFYRLDPNMTRGIGGTGLGLYISRELVRRMGGRIWVDSEPGRGSTFAFELPVVGAEAEVALHGRRRAGVFRTA